MDMNSVGLKGTQPSSRPGRPFVLIGTLWGCVAGVNVALSLLGSHAGVDVPSILGTNLCGLGVSLALSSATRQLRLHKARLTGPALLALAVLGGFGVWALDASLQFWSTQQWHCKAPPIAAFFEVRYNFVYFTLIFALQAAALALLASREELAVQERQLSKVRFSEQQARLTALTLQLNPHFLFNALNALTTLVVEERTEEAEDVLSRLSTFLRSSLSLEPKIYITLDSELETVQAYLEIENARYRDRLSVEYECEPNLGDALVPPLILQPLVENAIRYAVAPSLSLVKIRICARLSGARLVLDVEDSGAEISPCGVEHGAGIGLTNIAARLEALYGDSGQLVTLRLNGGFKSSISFPFSTEEEVGLR